MKHVIGQTLSISSFVLVMMLVIEYVNVLTRGVWHRNLAGSKWGQYGVAALLGVIPGCLGSFMAVGLYSHRMLSVGAVVTAMIATSGDDAAMLVLPASGFFIIATIIWVIRTLDPEQQEKE